MNKYLTVLLLIILILTLWLTGFAAAQPDIVGTWLGKTEVPNQGPDDLTLIITKGETGFSGTLVDTLGLIIKDTEVKDIKFQDKELTFYFPLIDGAEISVKMTVDGDKMTGAWAHPEGDMGALVFERKK
ncbi:MAG: hypothetical protein Q8O91_00130 [Candidatus Aminicenantes bacterium]|nr:hypothetical protein [Candidatus Aminicenantes bacterium]